MRHSHSQRHAGGGRRNAESRVRYVRANPLDVPAHIIEVGSATGDRIMIAVEATFDHDGESLQAIVRAVRGENVIKLRGPGRR